MLKCEENVLQDLNDILWKKSKKIEQNIIKLEESDILLEICCDTPPINTLDYNSKNSEIISIENVNHTYINSLICDNWE